MGVLVGSFVGVFVGDWVGECSADGFMALLPMLLILLGAALVLLLVGFLVKKYVLGGNDEQAHNPIATTPTTKHDKNPVGFTPNPLSMSKSGHGAGNALMTETDWESEDEDMSMGDDDDDVDMIEEEEDVDLNDMNELAQYEAPEAPDFEGMMDSMEGIEGVMKIAMGYLQVLTAVSFTMPGIPWPTGFINAICAPFSILNFDASKILPIGCAFEFNFFIDMQFSMALPILICGLAIIMDIIDHCRLATTSLCRPGCTQDHDHVTTESRVEKAHDIRLRTWKFSLFGCFVLYPMLVMKTFGVFKCREIEGDWWLEADVTLACYDDEWLPRAVLGAIGIVIYAIGIPVMFFVMLQQNKDDIENPDVVAKLGFLFTGYSASFFLGELVEMTRKMVMSGLVMFIAPESVMQIVVAIFFCGAFLMIQVVCNPFEDEAENKVNEWTLWGSMMTILFGMLIMMSKGPCVSEETKSEISLLANLILIVNVFVMFMIMWWTVFLIKSEVDGHIEMIADFAPDSKDSKIELNKIADGDKPGKSQTEADYTSKGTGSEPTPTSDLDKIIFESFHRFANDSGVICQHDDMLAVVFSMVSKLNMKVSPKRIEDTIFLVSRNPRFKMNHDKFAEWFKENMQQLMSDREETAGEDEDGWL